MRILFLSQRFVLPMDTGGKIRTGKILEQLARDNEITLVSNYDPRRDAPWRDRIEDLCARFVPVEWEVVPRHSARYLGRVLRHALSRYPVSVQNDYSRPLEDAILAEHARGGHDVAICDFVQSARLFEGVTGIPRVLFQHNVESMILERHMHRAGNPAARLFWRREWRKMLAFEGEACRAYDAVIAVSDADRAAFERLYALDNVATIPTGVDVEHFAPRADVAVEPASLVFCGSMDWLPNEDAMLFFVAEVLPRVRRAVPGATLTIVGRDPSPRLKAAVAGRDDVRLTGWVDDTRPYLAAAAACVVPLRIGGGTRMKIYEAMAMGKAVVSTPIGAEGLDVSDGETIVLATEAGDLADAVAGLLGDPGRRERIGKAARRHVVSRYAWSRVAEVFQGICEAAACTASSRTRASA